MKKYTKEYCSNRKVAIQVFTTDDVKAVDRITGKNHSYLYNNLYYDDQCITVNAHGHSEKEWYEENNYEIITAQQFLDDNWVLPEKWCFKGCKEALDENKDTPQWKWFYDKAKQNFAFTSKGYYLSNGLYQELFPKGYTEITFEQFQKYVLKEESKELTELPSAWYVKNDGSQLFKDTVIKYLNEKFDASYYGYVTNSYYGIDADGNDKYWSESYLNQFGENAIELTLEQFIKLTKKEMEKPFNNENDITYKMITTHSYFRTLSKKELQDIVGAMNYNGYQQLEGELSDDKGEILYNKFQNELNMKEIIGYKCPQDLFDGVIKKATVFIQDLYQNKNVYYPSIYRGYAESPYIYQLPNEIVETWEPVYKEEVSAFKEGEWIKISNTDSAYTTHSEAESKIKIGESYSRGTSPKPGLYKFLRYDSWESIKIPIIIVTDGTLIYFLGINSDYINNFTKATKEEIESHLVNLAKEKGFNYGVRFLAVRDTTTKDFFKDGKTSYSSYYAQDAKCSNETSFYYNLETDTLTTYGFGVYVVYEKGVWATIVPEEKIVSVKTSSNNFDVKVTKNGFEVERQFISVEEIRDLLENVKVGAWWAAATCFDIGCKKGVQRESLVELLRVHNSL